MQKRHSGKKVRQFVLIGNSVRVRSRPVHFCDTASKTLNNEGESTEAITSWLTQSATNRIVVAVPSGECLTGNAT